MQTKDLVIVGFSGFGKEVFWLASRMGINVRGFLDDNPATVGQVFCSIPVLGGIESWMEYSDCDFVIAIGNPRIRKKIHDKMCSQGKPSFATLIDPKALIMDQYTSVGRGSIVCAGTIGTVEISIGAHVIVNLNCTIGHETVIDDFATIAPMVAISGNVKVGQGTELGTGVSIRQGLSVGDGAMVGMGSVVTKDVAKSALVYGNPAKLIKIIDKGKVV